MKRAYLLLCVAFWTIWTDAHAADVPVSKMQNALSGVIQAKAVSEGFTAADPRVTNTLVRSSYPATDAVIKATEAKAVRTGAAVSAVTASWGSVAAVLGASIVVGAAVGYLLGYQGAKWYYSRDGQVRIGDNPQSVNTPAGMAVPSEMWCYSNVCAATAQGACPYQPKGSNTSQGRRFTITHSWVGGECHGIWTFDDNGTVLDVGFSGAPTRYASNRTVCPGIGLSASNGICPASNFPEAAPVPLVDESDAVNRLSSSEKASPLPLEPVADIANNAWRNAASSPGYDGLPYDASNPITTGDVGNWQSANPNYWPTVGDFVTPQPLSYSSPGSSTNPIPSTGSMSSSPASQSPFGLPTATAPQSTVNPSNSAPNTGTNPSTQPVENLGPDPGIGAPGLEPIPTAQQIIAPLTNAFPSVKSFVVPSIDAQCPTWQVPVFGKDIGFTNHCALLEQTRPTLVAVMAVVYALMALFIVLRA